MSVSPSVYRPCGIDSAYRPMELAVTADKDMEPDHPFGVAVGAPVQPGTAPHRTEHTPLASILGASLLMTGMSILSTGLSFAYQLMVASQFGAVGVMDAYLAAMALPAWLNIVFLTSLQFTFVPVFVEHLTRGSEDDAWKIAATLLRLTFVALILVCLVALFFAPQLINWIAPGLKGNSHDWSVQLLRILLPSVIFSAVFGLVSGIHFSLRSFLWPALAPVVYTVVNMLVLWYGAQPWGIGSVAAGTTLGQLAQVCVVLPILGRSWRSLRYFDLGNTGVRKVLTLMAPLVAISLASRSTDLIERFFASNLPEGSISYLGYAWKLLTPISEVLVIGFVTALFPLMAEQATARAQDGSATLRRTVTLGLRLVLFVMLPVASLLTILRVPLITVVLERGAFDHRATLGTADAMLLYLGAFGAAGVIGVLSRGFYALKDTSTGAKVGIFGVALYVGGAALLVGTLSFTGLALAKSVSALVTAILLAIFLARKLGGLPWEQLCRSIAKVVLSCGVSAVSTYLVWSVIEAPQRYGIVGLLLPGALGLTVFGIACRVLKCEEILFLSRVVRAKLTRVLPSTT